MNYSGKRVLVTGAGGFVGSHLCEALVDSGASVRALFRYKSEHGAGWLEQSPYLKSMEPVYADITDRDSLIGPMQGVDVVFHLAAQISVPYSYEAPESFVQTNIQGTLNILRTARLGSQPRIVHTSTSEVYGSAQTVPIFEDHPKVAQSPYAASKIGADAMCEAAGRIWPPPLKVVTLRPFNTFGPRQSTRAIVPTIIGQALKSDVIKLGSVTPRRDLNYVANSVEGYLLAGLADDVNGIEINLGTGRDVSIGEVVEMVGAAIGRTLTVVTEDQRVRPERSEVTRLIAGIDRAEKLLGWTPRISLEEGIAKTIAWMRAHLNLYASTAYAV